jgi:Rieske Fe-S protein
MKGNVVDVAINDFPELSGVGGAVEIDLEGYRDPIVVLRRSENEFLALSPVCTHLGCTVQKEPDGFRCPCHGSTYALDGTVVRGPAERPLTKYRTELTGNSLFIHL